MDGNNEWECGEMDNGMFKFKMNLFFEVVLNLENDTL